MLAGIVLGLDAGGGKPIDAIAEDACPTNNCATAIHNPRDFSIPHFICRRFVGGADGQTNEHVKLLKDDLESNANPLSSKLARFSGQRSTYTSRPACERVRNGTSGFELSMQMLLGQACRASCFWNQLLTNYSCRHD